MEARPRINVPLSLFDKVLEQASKILLAALWIFTVYTLFTLPAIIPVHFNASGKTDSYGSKATLLILPVFATLAYVGLTWLNKYPQLFNYIPKITEENAARQYTIATRMLRFLKVSLLLILLLLTVFSYFVGKGFIDGLGDWFLPVTFILIFLPVIFCILQLLQKK